MVVQLNPSSRDNRPREPWINCVLWNQLVLNSVLTLKLVRDTNLATWIVVEADMWRYRYLRLSRHVRTLQLSACQGWRAWIAADDTKRMLFTVVTARTFSFTTSCNQFFFYQPTFSVKKLLCFRFLKSQRTGGWLLDLHFLNFWH